MKIYGEAFHQRNGIEIQIADHRAMILFALSNSWIACEESELPHSFTPSLHPLCLPRRARLTPARSPKPVSPGHGLLISLVRKYMAHTVLR